MPNLYIGILSGTSVDAVDAALVEISPQKICLLDAISQTIAPEIRRAILDLCQSGPDEIERIGQLDNDMGELFADCVLRLLAKNNLACADIAAIGSHGQTIRHRPSAPRPFTLQIGNPHLIAARTKIDTVADFRRRDIALGGEGAPLAPAVHGVIFHDPSENRAVLNIGGMANITFIGSAGDIPLTGFDTGPGNVLLDAWVERHQQNAYDERGSWAATGIVQENLLAQLMQHPFISRDAPKSTGRECFNLAWLDQTIAKVSEELSPVDTQATLSQFTAESVAVAIEAQIEPPQRLIVCGGGVHNEDLLVRLSQRLPNIAIDSSSQHRVDPDHVESLAFAWLARQAMEREAVDLTQITGAGKPTVLGSICYA